MQNIRATSRAGSNPELVRLPQDNVQTRTRALQRHSGAPLQVGSVDLAGALDDALRAVFGAGGLVALPNRARDDALRAVFGADGADREMDAWHSLVRGCRAFQQC